jgi:hypothetical protein
MLRQIERSQALVNQVSPLDQVKHDKRNAEEDRREDPFLAFALSPLLEAETPNTIVKLEDSRQKVITDEKTMLG